MPRLLPLIYTPPSQRLFHTYTKLQNASTQSNHYETLKISSNATPAEVKKSFYALSKAHHPDLHPDDPNASKRFVAISEAYTILGTPAKRQQYDREVLQTPNSNSNSQPVHKGSYHSSGPAGGRPASGLSRRRTHFQGPPPSFYRNGGWGDHGAKRAAAQNDTSSSHPSSNSSSSASHTNTPYHLNQEVPHFDWREHLRTHEKHSRRLRERRRMMEDPMEPGSGSPEEEGSTLTPLFFWGGFLLLVGFLPSLFVKVDGGVGAGIEGEKKWRQREG